MSKKNLVFVLTAVVMFMSLLCAACDGEAECTNCQTMSDGSKQVLVNGQYVDPTPIPSGTIKEKSDNAVNAVYKVPTDRTLYNICGLGVDKVTMDKFIKDCVDHNGIVVRKDFSTVGCYVK